jgi:hypothetical protein
MPSGLSSSIVCSILPGIAHSIVGASETEGIVVVNETAKTDWKAVLQEDLEDLREEKVRENRVRRMAERQSLRLQKSRRRDPMAPEYGRYWLSDPWRNLSIAGDQFGWTLDDVEEYLLDSDREAKLERLQEIRTLAEQERRECEDFMAWSEAHPEVMTEGRLWYRSYLTRCQGRLAAFEQEIARLQG